MDGQRIYEIPESILRKMIPDWHTRVERLRVGPNTDRSYCIWCDLIEKYPELEPLERNSD